MSVRGIAARIASAFTRDRIDAELAAEIDEHLRLAEDGYRAQGLPGAQARDAARREFGNAALAREASRDEWTWPSLESYVADLRFGFRVLRKHWTSTAVAVVALGIGIGATTGVVSTLDAVRHHRYPYAKSSELAILWAKSLRHPQYDEMQVSLPELRDWQQRATTVRVAGFSWTQNVNVAVDRTVERLRASRVSTEFLPLLGVRAFVGRVFAREDDAPSADNAVIVSYSFWRDHLNANPAALRNPIVIDRQPYSIIGVLPRDFEMPLLGDVPILLPMRGATWLNDADARSLVAVGRLARGATTVAAGLELDALSRHFDRRVPSELGEWTVNVDPLATTGRAYSIRTLAVMLALSWLVLLVACANVGILLLARIPAREHELSIRIALGAGQRRILRQLVLESAILAMSAAMVGLLIARPVNGMLVRLVSESLPFTISPSLTTMSMTAALALAALTSAIFGVAPAVTALRRAATTSGQVRRQAGSRGHSAFRAAMLATEAAMSIVLLVGGWLMLESVQRMHATDIGFDPRGLITARVSLDAARYPTAASERAIYSALLDRLRARHDIRDASLASSVPLAVAAQMASSVTGKPTVADRTEPTTAGAFVVMPNFFDAMRIPFVDGTSFNATNMTRGVIVNEELARRLWPGKRAIGQTLTVGAPMFDDGLSAPPGARRVIGVTRTLPISLLRTASARHFPVFYLPADDVPMRAMFVVVRADAPAVGAAAIREAVKGLDPLLPVFSVQTSDDLLAYWYGPIHVDALITGVLAGVGLLLTLVGIYSVVAVFVSQRRREIGVRIAIGAQVADVLALVLRRTLKPAIAGCIAGGIIAALTSRWAASLFFDTSPLEPRAFGGATLLLGVVVTLAAMIPAARATRVDPRTALASD